MSRTPGADRRSGGFTLVEVLVALTLTAVILPVAMRGVSLSTAAAGHARRLTEAAFLGETEMAELVASRSWQRADLSGDFGDAGYPDYRWSAAVRNWEEGELQQLDVTVTWLERGGERSFTLTTLVVAGVE